MTQRLEFASRVAAPPAQVWRHACSMAGVNAELGPWMRMTPPADRSSLDGVDVPLGELLFRSWVLFLGVLPVDRHAFVLEQIEPGSGFDERSSSWTEKIWVHRRRIEPVPGGARVSDVLEFEPRVFFMAPLLRAIVHALFSHRHRKLRRLFGSLDG